jgi:hypothetical protein
MSNPAAVSATFGLSAFPIRIHGCAAGSNAPPPFNSRPQIWAHNNGPGPIAIARRAHELAIKECLIDGQGGLDLSVISSTCCTIM